MTRKRTSRRASSPDLFNSTSDPALSSSTDEPQRRLVVNGRRMPGSAQRANYNSRAFGGLQVVQLLRHARFPAKRVCHVPLLAQSAWHRRNMR
jgi:hypothetical protein